MSVNFDPATFTDDEKRQKVEMLERKAQSDRLAFPVNTIVMASHEALCHGKNPAHWEADEYGEVKLAYHFEGQKIRIYFTGLPEANETIGTLCLAVNGLSVETADILLIILGYIAGVNKPRDPFEPVLIRCEDIAAMRGVKHRDGSAGKLMDVIQQEVLKIARLGLYMIWRDKSRLVHFGTDAVPDRLIHLVEVKVDTDGHTWEAFSVQAGQALGYFLGENGGPRWIGYYSQALLRIDPYRGALVKKLGFYWISRGVISAKKGKLAHATPYTILKAIGGEAGKEGYGRPDRLVERFIQAHERLQKLGILQEVSGLEKIKARGKLSQWLETKITVKLSENLWRGNGPTFSSGKMPTYPGS